MGRSASPPAAGFTDLMRSVGNALRSRRRSKGWTLERLSNKAGVSVGFLSQIEMFSACASVEVLHKISSALGITLTQLFQLADVHIKLPNLEETALNSNKKIS